MADANSGDDIATTENQELPTTLKDSTGKDQDEDKTHSNLSEKGNVTMENPTQSSPLKDSTEVTHKEDKPCPNLPVDNDNISNEVDFDNGDENTPDQGAIPLLPRKSTDEAATTQSLSMHNSTNNSTAENKPNSCITSFLTVMFFFALYSTICGCNRISKFFSTILAGAGPHNVPPSLNPSDLEGRPESLPPIDSDPWTPPIVTTENEILTPQEIEERQKIKDQFEQTIKNDHYRDYKKILICSSDQS